MLKNQHERFQILPSLAEAETCIAGTCRDAQGHEGTRRDMQRLAGAHTLNSK